MKKTNSKKGFSIMEALISAFILSVGLVAVLQLYSASIKNSFESRNRIIASGLSQEGIELARNVRDTNVLEGNDVFEGLLGVSSSGLLYGKVDVYGIYEGTHGGASGFNGKKLWLNNNSGGSGLYEHFDGIGGSPHNAGTAQETVFHRRITTLPNATADELLVTVEVVWGRGDFPANDHSECIASNKCMYTQATFTKWQ